ncbi:hypothetical protein, partial [Myroides odoratus]|uniref:hypothetical protein n=1 Tax=Myroides odoratus TaxID=256 RepID=UPI001E59E358
SSKGHIAMCPYVYIEVNAFLRFCKERFWKMNLIKEEYLLKKMLQAKGALPCARTGGERYFYFLMLSLYI